MEHVIKINGKAYEQVAKHDIEYNQTWAEGAERDFGGTWNGTVLGNFDTVKTAILPKNKLELSNLIKDLRKGFIQVEYYDHELMGMKTKTFYRANFPVKTFYISELETFVDVIDITFIPERKN